MVRKEEAMTTPQSRIAELVTAAMRCDDQINAMKECPTGDDYNARYGLVREMAAALALPLPLPMMPPRQQPDEPTVYECPECDWTGTMDEISGLGEIEHIDERVEPGELAPPGCPNCDRLIAVDDRDVPHHTLYNVGLIMRQRGWTVAVPADGPSLNPT
jgi:hypothetical protein